MIFPTILFNGEFEIPLIPFSFQEKNFPNNLNLLIGFPPKVEQTYLEENISEEDFSFKLGTIQIYQNIAEKIEDFLIYLYLFTNRNGKLDFFNKNQQINYNLAQKSNLTQDILFKFNNNNNSVKKQQQQFYIKNSFVHNFDCHFLTNYLIGEFDPNFFFFANFNEGIKEGVAGIFEDDLEKFFYLGEKSKEFNAVKIIEKIGVILNSGCFSDENISKKHAFFFGNFLEKSQIFKKKNNLCSKLIFNLLLIYY